MGVGKESFERLHERLGGDAWLVGSVTGQELAEIEVDTEHADRICRREPWFARRDAAAYGIAHRSIRGD